MEWHDVKNVFFDILCLECDAITDFLNCSLHYFYKNYCLAVFRVGTMVHTLSIKGFLFTVINIEGVLKNTG